MRIWAIFLIKSDLNGVYIFAEVFINISVGYLVLLDIC